ncbi:MAG: hypothetical protein ACR2PO_20420 [Methyloligellaceae bacterium]
MRSPALFLFGVLTAWPAEALADPPPVPVVVAMAQHFVQDHFMQSGTAHYHIEFDTARLYPQPEENAWSVVGGFVSGQTTPNIYVVDVRLTCADFNKPGCWSLEKLEINRKVILDRGRPL